MTWNRDKKSWRGEAVKLIQEFLSRFQVIF